MAARTVIGPKLKNKRSLCKTCIRYIWAHSLFFKEKKKKKTNNLCQNEHYMPLSYFSGKKISTTYPGPQTAQKFGTYTFETYYLYLRTTHDPFQKQLFQWRSTLVVRSVCEPDSWFCYFTVNNCERLWLSVLFTWRLLLLFFLSFFLNPIDICILTV